MKRCNLINTRGTRGCAVLRGGVDLLRSHWIQTNKSPVIVNYHGVLEKYENRHIQDNQIELFELRKQLDYLRKRFDIVCIDEFCQALVLQEKRKRPILTITVDDGYANTIKILYPELRDRGITASLYLPTGLIDRSERIPTYYVRSLIWAGRLNKIRLKSLQAEYSLDTETRKLKLERFLIKHLKQLAFGEMQVFLAELRGHLTLDKWEDINHKYVSESLMSWEDACQLLQDGISIGSHGVNHISLHSRQGPNQIQNEIYESKNRISEVLGKCDYFSFPNGDRMAMGSASLKNVSAAGYKLAFSTEKGVRMTMGNRFELPRVCEVKSLNRLRLGLARYKLAQSID